MPLRRRNLPSGTQVTPDSVADASLFGGIELPGVIAGALGKATKLSPDDLMELHELLGKPIKIGRRLLRLSSFDPQKNTAIIHDATSGERIASPGDELLKAWRRLGEETADEFPEGAVLSQPGERVTNALKFSGPRGGAAPVRRTIPPKATR